MLGRLKRVIQASHWRISGRPILSLVRFIGYWYMLCKRLLRQDRVFYARDNYGEVIDVYIPCIEKDLQILPEAIGSVRKYVRHKIGNIYVVAPSSSKNIMRICAENDCIFVDESRVLSFSKSQLKYVHNGEDRSGWIYQQLLKLNADKVCKNSKILIYDADLVLIRPRIFFIKGRPIFSVSDFYHKPYYDTNYRLLGLKHTSFRSYVAHHMPVQSEVLKVLRKDIETVNGVRWHKAIIAALDLREASGFSEYELYADYYIGKLKYPYRKYNWANLDLSIESISQLTKLKKAFRKSYASLAVHNYNR